MSNTKTFGGIIGEVHFYPILLTREEIYSDYQYSEKKMTTRWTRNKDGAKAHRLLIDWNGHRLWVDGELYFEGDTYQKIRK